MRKIRNPFKEMDNGSYLCFGCSPANRIGLKMEFWDNGDEIIAHWLPEKHFEGFHDVLHGGIQATLMDEAASWLVLSKYGTAGVTSELHVKYLKPVAISAGKIVISARLSSVKKRILNIDCKLSDENGNIYSTGEVICFIFPEKIAREKYRYPGVDAFSE
jgi:uncharacterized protein (TIGR00369 family)